jgi:hypothetical protein
MVCGFLSCAILRRKSRLRLAFGIIQALLHARLARAAGIRENDPMMFPLPIR